MSSAYGKTWWGQQWLQSLSNIDYSNRLPRGASYARKGAVKKITITGNRIKAKVAGSRVRPYDVDIIIPPFFDPELGNFLNAIKQRPVIISKLLNRELDPSVLSLAEKSGLKVFPRQWSDLKMQCSCPDWAVPCKHLASVIYKVSTEIDNNPFLVFELHNVDLPGELAKAGIIINSQATEVPRISSLLFEKAGNESPYNTEKAYQKLNFSELEPLHEPLTALLTPMPAFYTASTSDFRDKYLATIKRVVKNTQRAASGKMPLPEFFRDTYSDVSNITHHTINQITLDEAIQAKVITNQKEWTVSEFLIELSHIPGSRTPDYQPSTAALHSALHLALQLTANGAIIPQIVQLPNKEYSIRWLPALLNKRVKKLCNDLDEILPPDVFTGTERKKNKPVNKDRAVNLLSLLITEMVHLASFDLNNDHFLELFFKNITYTFTQPGEEALAGGIMVWLQKFYLSQGDAKPSLVVHELNNNNFKVDINVQLPESVFKDMVSLKDVLTTHEFEHRRYEILQSLAMMSSFIDGLDDYINSTGEKEIIMDTQQFAPFLMKIVPAIQLLDISVLLPKSLQQILKPKPSVKLKSKGKSSGFLRLDKLLDFEWQIAIGDNLMDEASFRKLLQQSEGLIRFKSSYIYVEKEELEKIHKHFSSSKQLSAFQMMRAALSGEYLGAPISFDSEVEQLMHELTNLSDMPLPNGINAQLRPYQERGFSWIYRNARIGFGSVLADDMGLGKTLQVIVTLLKFKEEGHLNKEKVLIVAPTGLLTNWIAEIQKFAPSLNAEIYHGSYRDLEKTGNYDILITSYGILRSDADLLKKKKWYAMVIDEAQNIKNTTTAQTKAVKSIKAENYIAMSGTPVENRLSELWSIMDFSNRGFLGSAKEFAETYGNPIEQLNDTDVADKLKKVTAPFLMRRLKSDKTIISDLPEKIEIDTFASLTKEQAGLYEKTLEEALKQIEGIAINDQQSLFVRQGLVLQMILALKQVCNHPAQFLKNGITNPALSGKTSLLFNKLDSIIESNEKVLIFTQFTEMAKLLEHFIQERYGEKPLYYHGGCTLKQRKDMVEQFQTNHADKIFLLSLKAAGTGLNLTAANHVIHYDLWWNPAVEAQATDRAYRIGQKNNVMVHRFITKNTFEERINEMIQQKKALAEMTVSTGENWIGNLSNKELRELFVLD
ncbi:MAG: DEAD/DEAH box helicase [Marinilabiliaceae bacterium]|nr:DEAD/DEAH box helicase [Marinilabiliaceae bacterium]